MHMQMHLRIDVGGRRRNDSRTVSTPKVLVLETRLTLAGMSLCASLSSGADPCDRDRDVRTDVMGVGQARSLGGSGTSDVGRRGKEGR